MSRQPAEFALESALRRLGETVIAARPPASLRARVLAEAYAFAAWPALGLTLLPASALDEGGPDA